MSGRPSFTMIPDGVLARTDLTLSAKVAYAVIVDAMRDDVARIGVRLIARKMGGTRPTVADAILAVERAGLLVVERGRPGQRSIYLLPKAVKNPDALGGAERPRVVKKPDGCKKCKKKERPRNRTLVVKNPDGSGKESGHVKDQTIQTNMAAQSAAPSPNRRPDKRVSAFWKHWLVAYEKSQRKPFVDGAPRKDRAIVRRLLDNLDRDRPDADALELLKVAADRLCRGRLRWASGSPTIGLLSTGLNQLLPETESPVGDPTAQLIAGRFPSLAADACAECAALVASGAICADTLHSMLATSDDADTFITSIREETSRGRPTATARP